jgi:hypothetical protein
VPNPDRYPPALRAWPLRSASPAARRAATHRGHTRRCVTGTPGSIGRSNAFHKVVRHASQFLVSGRYPISHVGEGWQGMRRRPLARRALVQRRRWVRDGCVPCSSTNLNGSAASPRGTTSGVPEDRGGDDVKAPGTYFAWALGPPRLAAVAFAPSSPETPDTFRLSEALELAISQSRTVGF